MSLHDPRAHLVIRTDGGPNCGLGHVMRCLALAQGWHDGGRKVTFVMTRQASFLEARLQSEGMAIMYLSVPPGSVQDAHQTASAAQHLAASWVMVDGYHFGADYQQIIKSEGFRLLFVDDTDHASHYYADIVLNQNTHAHEGLYAHREPYTNLLLGTRYALLQRNFMEWRGWKRNISDVARRTLITLGGSDANNVTLKVIQAFQEINIQGIEAVAVLGAANSHAEALQSSIRNMRLPVRLLIDASNMPELMAWADIAIAASGITSWELAFMGLPCCTLVLADNQRPTAEALEALGVAVNLGWYEHLSSTAIAQKITRLVLAPETRATMAHRGPELVDGMGVTRVLDHLLSSSLSAAHCN